MKYSAPFLVSLTISTVSWGNESCTQNPMRIDVCRAAATISETIAEGLPLRINHSVVLQAIHASENVISMRAVFDYTEDYLVAHAKETGVTLDSLKMSVRKTAMSIACRPETELQAFIKLGGKLRFTYDFLDKEHFLTVNVDRCAPG